MPPDSTFETSSLTTLHWVGIALAVATGLIHLVFGVLAIDTLQGVSFVLAAVAFFVASALVAANYRRRLLYLVGVPFTAVQIVLYFYLNWPNVWGPAGIADKLIQSALIVVLVVLYRRESRPVP